MKIDMKLLPECGPRAMRGENAKYVCGWMTAWLSTECLYSVLIMELVDLKNFADLQTAFYILY